MKLFKNSKVVRLFRSVRSNALSPTSENTRLTRIINYFPKVFKQVPRLLNKRSHSSSKWKLLTESDHNSDEDEDQEDFDSPRIIHKDPTKYVLPKVKQRRDRGKFITLTTSVANKFTSFRISSGSVEKAWTRNEKAGNFTIPEKGRRRNTLRYETENLNPAYTHCDENSESIKKIPLDEISSFPESSRTRPSSSSLDSREGTKDMKLKKERPLLQFKTLRKSGKAFGSALKSGFVAMGKSAQYGTHTLPEFYEYQVASGEYYHNVGNGGDNEIGAQTRRESGESRRRSRSNSIRQKKEPIETQHKKQK